MTSRRKNTLIFAAFSLTLLAFGFFVLLQAAESIYSYEDSVDGISLPSVDAIVCLSGGRGRVSAAGDLWLRYWEHSRGRQFPRILVLGTAKATTPSIVLSQMRSGIKDLVKKDTLMVETQSSDTIENMEELLKMSAKFQWRRILLVTSQYHMVRSLEILQQKMKKMNFELELHTYSVIQDPYEKKAWKKSLLGIFVTLSEYLKLRFFKVMAASGLN